MKKSKHSEVALIKLSSVTALLLSMNSHFSTAFAQGSLTPPGAPAPVMKSLAQIEPRTPISSAPFTINQPGSYYLTTNVTVSSGDAITIMTNGVALDLNGFTVSSTTDPAAGTAISFSAGGLQNITIRNGFIQGGVTNNGSIFGGRGFGYGINFTFGPPPANVFISHVSIAGCQYSGINLSSVVPTVVEFCTVNTVGGGGIAASIVKGSAATACGATAIFGYAVSDSLGVCYYGGDGISAWSAQSCYGISYGGSGSGVSARVAQNCYGYCNGSGDGIFATSAVNCYGVSEGSGGGLYATTARDCYGEAGFGIGLEATTAQNCYGQSTAGIGLRCDVSHGIAIGCYGRSSSYVGLNTYIGNSCVGEGPTPISVSYKYNMP